MTSLIEDDDTILGRELVAKGSLLVLRRELGLTVSAMAEFIGVDLITYRKWESRPETRLWSSRAQKLGRFYTSVQRQLQILSDLDVKLSGLMPFHEVATLRGLTQEGLLHMYRAGNVDGVVELGVLGLWLQKDKIGDIA